MRDIRGEGDDDDDNDDFFSFNESALVAEDDDAFDDDDDNDDFFSFNESALVAEDDDAFDDDDDDDDNAWQKSSRRSKRLLRRVYESHHAENAGGDSRGKSAQKGTTDRFESERRYEICI